MKNDEEALANVPLFAGQKSRDLKRLASLCVPKHFEAGAEMLKEGALGLGLFLISEGRVEVFKTEDGRRRRLAVLGPGDVLGEMALIDDEPRSASALALTRVETLFLSRASFGVVVHKTPAVAWALVPTLASRLREVEELLVATDAGTEGAGNGTGEADGHETGAARDDSASYEAGWLLLAPYAFLMSGAAGLGVSVQAFRSFLRTLAEETDLEREGRLRDVLSKLPRGAVAAAASSLDEARKIPESMLDALQHPFEDPGDSHDGE